MACSSSGVDGIPWSKDKWLCPSIKGHLLKPVKRTRGQMSGGSAPRPTGFRLACPLLTLVFILSCVLFHSFFFPSLYLSLPMALANTSLDLQTTLGDDRSDGLWNCTNGAHASQRHRNRRYPRLQSRPGCRPRPCAWASGARTLAPCPAKPWSRFDGEPPSLQLLPEVQKLSREFNVNSSPLIQFFMPISPPFYSVILVIDP